MPRPLFQILYNTDSESEYEGDPMEYDPLDRAREQFNRDMQRYHRPPSPPTPEIPSDAEEDDSDKVYKNVVVKKLKPNTTFPKRNNYLFWLPWRYKQNPKPQNNKK